MNSGRVSDSCLSRSRVSAVGAGHVDPVGGDGADPLERLHGGGVGRLGGGERGQHDGVAVRADPAARRPRRCRGRRRCRAASAGTSPASSPVPRRSATTSSGALKPGPKPSASRSYAVRSVVSGRVVAGVREAGLAATGPGRPGSAARATPATRYGHGRAEMRWASRHHDGVLGRAWRRAAPADDPAGVDAVAEQRQQRRQQGERRWPPRTARRSRCRARWRRGSPTPVRARAAIARTTVPPAKKTAVPDEPMAADSAGGVGLPGGAVLAVAGDDEQGVVDADAQPDHRADGRRGGGDVHGRRPAARCRRARRRRRPARARSARARPRRCRRRRAGRRGRQGGRPPSAPRRLLLGVEERGVAAELGLQAAGAGRLEGVADSAAVARPNSVDGTSSVISA